MGWERDGARHKVSDLHSRVFKLESQAQASYVAAVELADAIREPDRYKFLLQLVATQNKALKSGYADMVSRADTSHSFQRDELGPLFN